MPKIDSFKHWLLVSTLTGCAVAANTTGCGGSSAATTGGGDGGSDASADATSDATSDSGSSSGGGDSATDTGSGSGGQDSGADTGSGSGGQDSGADTGSGSGGQDSGAATDSGSPEAGSVCSGAADDTACVNPSTGASDFCVSQACNACVDTTDDGACATAYGSGHLCVGGACVPGDCHSSASCSGEICGVTTPDTCGACTDDLQCQGDPTYGPGYVCNTTTGQAKSGQCVPAACSTPDVACPANAADECCAGSGVTDTCIPGNCCTTNQCTSGQTCIGHTCSACAAATGNVYYVDPAAGSDSGHTGASTCPFKTITKAIEFIGGNAAAGTLIELVDDDPASNGETFPIIVPQNVTIETSTAVSTPVTVTVGAGKIGFALDATGSGLSNLVLDGAANTATTGIAVYGGSAVASTKVTNVTVQSFLGAGIVVGTRNKQATAGAVTLGPGLVVTGNGTTSAVAPGVQVSSGTATIVGTAAAGGVGHTSIHGNSQHGVLVTGTGYVTINPGNSAAVTAPGQATVDLDGNSVAGLFVAQTPGGAASQTNVVSGVEITGITSGNGIRVEGGSLLTLRDSYVVGNHDSGVAISTYGTGATASSSIAGIDLGTANAPGHNTLQGPVNNQTNPVAGVCLNLPAIGTGQTLSATGNVWSATVDCAVTAGTVTHSAACANGTDIGGISGAVNGNTANVSMCTLQ